MPTSVTKRLVNSRESLSLATLKGERVILEEIGQSGSVSNVNISPTMLADHLSAKRKYLERLEREKKEKAKRREESKKERELKRKLDEDKKQSADYQTKKRRLEDRETALKKELKFDETRCHGLEQQADSKDPNEMKSAFKALKMLREGMKKTQLELNNVKDEKCKLAEARRNKKQ